MLILTRRENETIVINGNIKVHFLGMHRNQARFGIVAPREISVHREEIQDKIESQKNGGDENE